MRGKTMTKRVYTHFFHDFCRFRGLFYYVEVGEITEIPEFGTKRAINTILTLGNSLARKSKGSQDSGTVAIPMLRVPSDAGQTIIQEAADSNNSYTFKVTLSDDFTPTTGHPTTFTCR